MVSVIVAGSRSITDKETVYSVLDTHVPDETELLIHGGCRGVDTLSGTYAEEHNIDVKIYEAKWDEYENSAIAGPIRNEQMAKNEDMDDTPDKLIAIYQGESTGTQDMISKAHNHNITVIERQIDQPTLGSF